MEANKVGEYLVRTKKSVVGEWDFDIKIKVNYLIQNRMSVTFLTTTYFCNIGYTNLYFKTHFESVFEVLEAL